MKRLVLWCFFWCTAIMATLAEEVPQVVNVMARQTTSLNGAWNYNNRKGLFSDEGQKKKAFYVLKEWYEKASSNHE